jgi:hypothetical protein
MELKKAVSLQLALIELEFDDKGEVEFRGGTSRIYVQSHPIKSGFHFAVKGTTEFMPNTHFHGNIRCVGG